MANATLTRTGGKFKDYGLQGGQITGSIEQYVVKALPADLLVVLRGVAEEELAEQVLLGNNPSQILVDGRPIKANGIKTAMQSVSLRFADASLLITAINEAYSLLQRVTRIQNPAKNSIVARKNYHLWLNGRPLGLLPGAFKRLVPTALDDKSVVRVVGPLVRYGRRLYFQPIGRSGNTISLTQRTFSSGKTRTIYGNRFQPRFRPFSDRTIRRLANRVRGTASAARLAGFQKNRPGTTEGIHQIVKRVMRGNRLFKPLHISDSWVSYPPAKSWGKRSKDDRVPSISVQYSRRGAVRISLS